MIAAILAYQPVCAALGRRIAKAMDTILHIGADRCATTSFHPYMRQTAVMRETYSNDLMWLAAGPIGWQRS